MWSILENRIVIGYKGEIGSAIMQYVQGTVGIDIECSEGKLVKGDTFLHICIPYSKKFIEQVIGYIHQYDPLVVLVHTTCPVGTTRKIHEQITTGIVHVPVHGSHPNILEDIRLYHFFVGAMDDYIGQLVCDYLDRYAVVDVRAYLCSSPESTEFHKIMSTELVRHTIQFYQIWKQHCMKMHINWAEVIAALQMIHDCDVRAGRQPFNARIFQRAGPIDTEVSGKHCLSTNKYLVPGKTEGSNAT